MNQPPSKTECAGVFGRLFGHHFVGHYNTTPPENLNFQSGPAGAIEIVATAMTARTYVCSVCVRCGEKK